MNLFFIKLLLSGIGSLMVSKVMNTIVALSPHVAVKNKNVFLTVLEAGKSKIKALETV